MKLHSIFLLVLVLFVSLISVHNVHAQYNTTQTLKLNRSYADTQLDTTATVQIGSYSRVGALFTCHDSAAVTIYAETQVKGLSSWVVKDSLSVTTSSNTGTSSEWILRDNTVEKVPGVSNTVRFRPKFLTGNGVTSAKYDLILYLSK